MTTALHRRALLRAMGMAGLATAAPGWATSAPRGKWLMKGQIGVQLYTMGELAERDLAGTLRRLAAIGYRDFELPGLYGRSPQAVRAEADAAGVRFSAMHMGLPPMVRPGSVSLASSAQEIADALGVLGITLAVQPFPLVPDTFRFPMGIDPRPAMVAAVEAGGLDMWKRLSDLLNERAAALRPHGISLLYHNHNMEFRPQSGTTGWQMLQEHLDPELVLFELDTGWLAAGGIDPATEIRRLGKRVKAVHLKDLQATTAINFTMQQDPIEIGRGTLDWPRVIDACGKAGVEHFFVEQEPPYTRDRFESMTLSFSYLHRMKI